ncbi:outer membrane beta-barrel protein [Psychroserpens algicola]|uniref:Outer membrane beta-barrel protein n=1 Tax=Psychroserpens algicola TaxID=1719034 RepID=A0ABT0H5I2_9FLAO|nr:outer membrane beta-barrel protein [Psychroserpens algicola]MCK8479616.1 outer membrane beta-barrel protein [Psychroserpens algicola]
MRHVLLLVFCFVVTLQLSGQQLFVEIGKSTSGFDYKNSSGEPLDNLLSKPNTYMEIGYRDVLNKNKTLFLSLGVMYNGYGAIGSDPILDNYFEWDVTYLGLNTGLDMRLFRLRDFSFYLRGRVSVEYLIRGTQTLNNQVFNLVGEDEFNNYIFFARAGFGMQYPISRNTSLIASYIYGKTVLIDGNKTLDQESLKLNNHQFGFGLIISLPSCNCTL